jgi:hypothetical protein
MNQPKRGFQLYCNGYCVSTSENLEELKQTKINLETEGFECEIWESVAHQVGKVGDKEFNYPLEQINYDSGLKIRHRQV